MRRSVRILGALAAVAAVSASASACGSSSGSYRLTAYFERTVGLYEGGDVLVMGLPVGSVDDIEIDGTRVRVELTIRGDVPLPADLQATIGQTQLIGERSVVLYPPWDAARQAAGEPRARDGDVIPTERTVEPVEPDEGLAAFDELARSLDGDVVRQFVEDSADVLDGRGAQLGDAIDQAAGLSTTLAEVDQQLVATADDLHALAGSLATRDEQLGRLVDAFSTTTELLASERDGIQAFIASLVALTDQGASLLHAYGDQLPGDIATATALASILAENTRALDQLLTAFPQLADGVAAAYQPSIQGTYLRTHVSPTVQSLLDVLADQLGVLP